jgi:hypothetical protein
MIYVLSCETVENGGGIYGYDLTEKGELGKLAFFLIQQQARFSTRGCQKPPAMLVANSFSFKPTICYTKKLLRAKLYVRLATVHK